MRYSWIILTLFGITACAPLTGTKESRRVAHRISVRHPGFASDAPKDYTLYQIMDDEGFPSEYTMVVDSVICLEKTCAIIQVTLAWDALGFYQRYTLAPGEVLEKGLPAEKAWSAAAPWKGVPFTEADYRKLDEILKDRFSLLREQKLPGIFRLNSKDSVDGITGATPAAVRNAVVAGASLTCYNLWHWANGEVAAAAKELTHRQCSEALLLKFLTSDRPHYALFALEHLKRHTLFRPSAVQAVIRAMAGGDRDRIDLGLAYLREALPDSETYFENVGTVILSGTAEGRAYLLNQLSSEKALPDKLFEALSADLPSWGSYYPIHLFLRLAEKHGCASQPLISQTAKLLDSADFFIARRAYGFLSRLPALDEPTAHRLHAFRDKAVQEGRNL